MYIYCCEVREKKIKMEQILRSYFLPRIEYLLRNIQIIPSMISVIISKLDPCMSYEFDAILGIVLKQYDLEVSPVLSKRSNKSINTLLLFCFPACWKLFFEVLQAPSEPSNYRTVSLLQLFGKVLQVLFNAELIRRLTPRGFLSDKQ